MFWIYGRLVSIITFGFAGGISLFPFILMRRPQEGITRQHELIHARQQLEVLIVSLPGIAAASYWHSSWWLLALIVQPFYLWYVLEYLVRWIRSGDSLRGYYDISFEQEAYAYQREPDYLLYRRSFAWVRFLRKRYPWPF